MIKFQGELSQECKKWFLKREFKAYLIVTCILSLIFAVINIIIALLWDLIALLFLILPIYCIVVLGAIFRKYVIKRVPSVITIDDGYIEGKNEQEEAYSNLDYVKRIIDFGAWYCFEFYFPHKIRWFICQKDLLVEGTIEEFEQLFEGKIIRKYK